MVLVVGFFGIFIRDMNIAGSSIQRFVAQKNLKSCGIGTSFSEVSSKTMP